MHENKKNKNNRKVLYCLWKKIQNKNNKPNLLFQSMSMVEDKRTT